MERENMVQLVDEHDNPIGLMEKLAAHRNPHLHRAISVFILNTHGEWLMHQRSSHKYHSRGLWTNACCTHPYEGESYHDAANRRLLQEMGMTCEVIPIFSFIYKARIDDELTEYEFDQVFVAVTDDQPQPNEEEVKDWKYMSFKELESDVKIHPENYTIWFRLILERVYSELNVFINPKLEHI